MKKALVFLTIATISTLTLAGCGSATTTDNEFGSIETTENDSSDFDQPLNSDNADAEPETEVSEVSETADADSKVDSATISAAQLPNGITVRNPANTPLCGDYDRQITGTLIEITPENIPMFDPNNCELSKPYLSADYTEFDYDSFDDMDAQSF